MLQVFWFKILLQTLFWLVTLVNTLPQALDNVAVTLHSISTTRSHTQSTLLWSEVWKKRLLKVETNGFHRGSVGSWLQTNQKKHGNRALLGWEIMVVSIDSTIMIGLWNLHYHEKTNLHSASLTWHGKSPKKKMICRIYIYICSHLKIETACNKQ